MAVRRREDPTVHRPIPPSSSPTAATRATNADDPPGAAAVSTSAEPPAPPNPFDGVRTSGVEVPPRTTRRIAAELHTKTLRAAEVLRDRGDTLGAIALLEGLRQMSPSRGVPSNEAFLAGIDDSVPTGEPDRLDGVLRAVRGEDPPPIRAEVHLAWLNDQFFFPNGDDDGFTQAAELGVTLRRGADRLDLDLRHGMLTERGGMRRVDELDIIGGVSRQIDHGGLELTFGATAGISLVGDYGGAELQDSFHGLIGMGRRLEGSLQDIYEGGNQAALIVGTDFDARRELGAGFSVEGGINAQLALGPTGVSRFAPRVGLDFEYPEGPVRPYAGASLELARFYTQDPRLEMNGGYGTREIEAIPSFSIGLRGDLFDIGWRGTINQNGSGANMGSIFLSFGRR